MNNIPVDLPPGYIDFFKDLESWQNEQQIYLQKQYTFEPIDLLPLLQQSHSPLLDIVQFDIRSQDYKDLLHKLLVFLQEKRPEISPAIKNIAAGLNALDIDNIIVELFQRENSYIATIADQLGVPFELLFFVMDHAFRPLLRVVASPFQQVIFEDDRQSWDYPTICPICGSKPHLSRLRAADGRRFMFCDRCFTEWEARYLQCVFCGNNQPGSIKYISVDNDDAYQIYTCDECKGYLKTYDERQAGKPTDMYIANMETIYLDMIAQENGYTNHDQD